MKTKKIIALILAATMIMAFASVAYASSKTTVICSSTTSGYLFHEKMDNTKFNLSNGTWTRNSGSATKMTLRAYDPGGYMNSNAKTYSSSVLSGGQDYWEVWYGDYVYMHGNLDLAGKVTITGSWTF